MTADVHAAAEGPDTRRAGEMTDADINEPDLGPLSPETIAELRKHGIEFTDWQPTVPVSPVAPQLVEALREIAFGRERPDGRVGWHDITARTPREIARAALAAVVPETPGTGGADGLEQEIGSRRALSGEHDASAGEAHDG